MDLTFRKIICPKCQTYLEQGSIQTGVDTQMVKRCPNDNCDFWMIILIPHKDFDYKIVREEKK